MRLKDLNQRCIPMGPVSPTGSGNEFVDDTPSHNIYLSSGISHTSLDNKIVDNSDVVGASSVGAALTASSFST